MVRLAAARGPVWVWVEKGREVQATLIAWLPDRSRRGRCARVQFASGRQRTVPTWAVRPVDGTPPPAVEHVEPEA